ncbi:DUF932 domain-containing protein, partial [Salmonella enterica]|uniref:DUF932 domain-containing protein n=1 Tax=Salmonella enterica TaxID=28901 RepID=UPI001EF0126F
MARLSSVFRSANVIRKERALTNDELMRCVPSVFSGEKHESRSDRYTYIPTITLLDNLRKEGFQPFFACQTRTRDAGKREHAYSALFDHGLASKFDQRFASIRSTGNLTFPTA